ELALMEQQGALVRSNLELAEQEHDCPLSKKTYLDTSRKREPVSAPAGRPGEIREMFDCWLALHHPAGKPGKAREIHDCRWVDPPPFRAGLGLSRGGLAFGRTSETEHCLSRGILGALASRRRTPPVLWRAAFTRFCPDGIRVLQSL